MSVKNIAVFASGTGSNAEKIIEYFKNREDIVVKSICTNKADAGVLKKAQTHNIETIVFDRKAFFTTDEIINDLKQKNISLIVLAGFLWLIPKSLIESFPDRIINIHPALLPKYGGKGMYGMNVHEAVSKSGDSETGITVHFVNSEYDKGKIISQIRCPIKPEESPQVIAKKVQKVEHQYFPMIIDRLLENKFFQV